MSLIFNIKLYYFLQAQSRNIVKYSFLAQKRVKEGNVPGMYSSLGPGYLNKVELMVDEKGLWAVYVGNSETGRIHVSQINRDTLGVEVCLMCVLFHSLFCSILTVMKMRRVC